MRELNGSELASFVKERQARQVRGLRQASGIFPKLAVIQTIDMKVIDTYVGLKSAYGDDILIDVDVYKIDQSQAISKIKELNDSPDVHGIIVQLPLADPSQTQQIIDAVSPEKDVDGLLENSHFDPATAVAINWLITGYGIDLRGKKIVIVGDGRLVGAPLAKMWRSSGFDVTTVKEGDDLRQSLENAQIIVSATGQPELITSDMIPIGAVVVDAGTADVGGKLVGDVALGVRESRSDIKITPVRGGVGPLTVCSLFENLIIAARNTAQNQ